MIYIQLLLQSSGVCPELQGMLPVFHLLHETGINLHRPEETPSQNLSLGTSSPRVGPATSAQILDPLKT